MAPACLECVSRWKADENHGNSAGLIIEIPRALGTPACLRITSSQACGAWTLSSDTDIFAMEARTHIQVGPVLVVRLQHHVRVELIDKSRGFAADSNQLPDGRTGFAEMVATLCVTSRAEGATEVLRPETRIEHAHGLISTHWDSTVPKLGGSCEKRDLRGRRPSDRAGDPGGYGHS